MSPRELDIGHFFVPIAEPAEDVEHWLASRSEEMANDPDRNWCGICAVRSIALCLELEPPSLEEMYWKAFDAHDVFRWIDGRVVGAYHRELADYVQSTYQLQAQAMRNVDIEKLNRLIHEDCFFIASVTPKIRDLDVTTPAKKNGHLVLVFGTDTIKGVEGFILHNSAGLHRTNTQIGAFVPMDRFDACFSGNGIVVVRP